MANIKMVLSMLSVVSLVAFVRAMPHSANATTVALSATTLSAPTYADEIRTLSNLTYAASSAAQETDAWPYFDELLNAVKREVNDVATLDALAPSFDEVVHELKAGPMIGDDKASVLAYDAASDHASAEAKNYAHGFAQYFDHEFPQAALLLKRKSDGDKFLWFMGKAGSSEAKEWLNKAIKRGETKQYQYGGSFIPFYRFDSPGRDDPNFSLEAYVFLRNFEKLSPPESPSESKALRLNRVVGWLRMNILSKFSSDQQKVFEYLYNKSHAVSGDDLVPDFSVLDEDVESLLQRVKAGEVLV